MFIRELKLTTELFLELFQKDHCSWSKPHTIIEDRVPMDAKITNIFISLDGRDIVVYLESKEFTNSNPIIPLYKVTI